VKRGEIWTASAGKIRGFSAVGVGAWSTTLQVRTTK